MQAMAEALDNFSAADADGTVRLQPEQDACATDACLRVSVPTLQMPVPCWTCCAILC